MKKILLTILLILFSASIATSGEVTLAWEIGTMPDSFVLFQRLTTGEYDYSEPVWSGTDLQCTLTLPANNTISIPAPAGFFGSYNRDTKTMTLGWQTVMPTSAPIDYAFVVRAEIDGKYSVDSNEVVYTDTASDETIDHYSLYYSDSIDGPWTIFSDAVHTTEITDPFTIAPDDVISEFYFTVVAFGTSGAYSPNATALKVIIDKRDLVAPTLFIVTVPVP